MATYDGLDFPEPEVRLTNFELAIILQGTPLVAMATDGQRLTIRLATMAELLDSVVKARDEMDPEARPPVPAEDALRQLTMPLPDDATS